MRLGLTIVCCGAVVACSPPHRFDILSDEPIENVELDLANMGSSEVRLVSSHHAVAEANMADSSGEIRVRLKGGSVVSCRVGYITNGEPEPHQLIVGDRRCNGV